MKNKTTPIPDIFNKQNCWISIVFEWPDGSWKTTLIKEISKKLNFIISNKKINLSDNILEKLNNKYDFMPLDILGLNTIFDSIKKTDKNWKIINEEFIGLWVYKITKIWERFIKQWDRYILKSENWHKVNILKKTSTLFLSDLTYRSKWFKKEKSNLLRWHAKLFPFMQKKVEKRDFSVYYTQLELKNTLVNEIKILLNCKV